MLARVRDPDAHRHVVDAAFAAEVRADVEDQLVAPHTKALALEQRRIRAAARVGANLRKLGAIAGIELDADAGTRLAARGIEHVCRESSYQPSPNIFAIRPRAM